MSYLNPNNLSLIPIILSVLLENIPWMFTVLGCAFFFIGIFSLIFIRENDVTPQNSAVFVYKNLSCREVLQRKWFYQVKTSSSLFIVKNFFQDLVWFPWHQCSCYHVFDIFQIVWAEIY